MEANWVLNRTIRSQCKKMIEMLYSSTVILISIDQTILLLISLKSSIDYNRWKKGFCHGKTNKQTKKIAQTTQITKVTKLSVQQ